MTQVADPVYGLVNFLRADATLATLCGVRIYGGELPDSQAAKMPETAVVIRMVGGGAMSASNSYMQIGDVRVDVTAYGSTPYEASNVYRAVYGALKQMVRTVRGKTLLHWARISSAGMSMRDRDTEWPLVLSTWQVMWSETETP